MNAVRWAIAVIVMFIAAGAVAAMAEDNDKRHSIVGTIRSVTVATVFTVLIVWIAP